MKESEFKVLGIDHIELFVPDRYQAATWYRRLLGLEVLEEYESWAEDPRGPLMISSDDGKTKLALFQGQPQESRDTAGFHRVAFAVDGPGFLKFLGRLRDLATQEDWGTSDEASPVDHDRAFSVYFSDPFGHRFEVTTYEHDYCRSRLGGKGGR